MRKNFIRTTIMLAALPLLAEDDLKATKEQLYWETLARTTSQLQNLSTAASLVNKDRADAWKNLCALHEIKQEECVVDEQSKSVTKKEAPKPPQTK